MKIDSRILLLAAGLLLLLAGQAYGARLSDDELRKKGMALYRDLPRVMGLGHAPAYANAVSYLFAFEQRLARQGRSLPRDEQEAFNWLYSHLNDLKIGKGDVVERAIADGELERHGMEAYRQAKSDESWVNGRIWDMRSYLRAKANLYAYYQCVSQGDGQVNAALRWLNDNADRLADAGGKGDFPAQFAAWKPDGPKPGSDGPTWTGRPIEYEVQMPNQEVEQSFTETPRPHRPDNRLIVRLRDLSARHEKLQEEHRALQKEHERLRVRHQMLERKYESTAARLSELESTTPSEDPAAGSDDVVELVLVSAGESTIHVTKVVRAFTGLGLRESKSLVDAAPVSLKQGMPLADAEKLSRELQAAGATVEIR